MTFSHLAMLKCLVLCALGLFGSTMTALDVDDTLLADHSFSMPLKFSQSPHWRPTLSTSSRHEQLILSPLLPNKAGHLWNKKPIRTSHFQIDFEFSVTTQDVTASNTGMGLIIADDVPSAYDLGSDFIGSNGRFNGFALVFSNSDSKGRASASSLTVNYVEQQLLNAPLAWPLPDKVEATTGKFIFKSGNRIEGRLIVKDSDVTVFIRNAPGKESKPEKFTQLIHVKSKTVSKGTKKFLGFTASSGRSDSPTAVSLFKVESNNLSQALLDESVILPTKEEHSKVHKTSFDDEGEATNLDALSHSEKMNHLSRIVYRYVTESSTRESSLDKSMTSLQDAVKRLNEDIALVNEDFRNITGATHKDTLSALKHDLSNSIKNMVKTSNEAHSKSQERLDTLKHHLNNSKAEGEKKRWEMKKLQDSAERIVGEVEITSSNSYLFVALFVIVFLGAAFALIRKERQLEKKHIL